MAPHRPRNYEALELETLKCVLCWAGGQTVTTGSSTPLGRGGEQVKVGKTVVQLPLFLGLEIEKQVWPKDYVQREFEIYKSCWTSSALQAIDNSHHLAKGRPRTAGVLGKRSCWHSGT